MNQTNSSKKKTNAQTIRSTSGRDYLLWGKMQNDCQGTSQVVQWLRLCASNAGGMGLIPGQGTKILHVTLCSQKKKKATVLHSVEAKKVLT